MDQVPSHVFDMIAAAQALADRPGTVEEGAAATAKVQKLLAKYNLTMAGVRQKSGTKAASATEGFLNEVFDLGTTTAWLTEWREQLVATLGRHNSVKVLYAGPAGHVYFVGEEHNVKVVSEMYGYLVKAIQRLAVEGWNGVKGTYRQTSHERKWKASFYTGAVSTIDRRLAEATREFKETLTQEESGLVVIEDDRLMEAYYTFYPSHRPRTAEERAASIAKMEEWKANNPEAVKKMEREAKRREYNRRRYEETHGYSNRRSSIDAGAYHTGRKAAEGIGLEKQVK